MILGEHWDYVQDETRTRQFDAAIRRSVASGARVLDLGCGVGILGILCLRAGAAEVVAIDRTAIVEVAREGFERAGYVGRAKTIRGVARHLALSDPVDLIVCDHVGYFGIDYGIVELLMDARRRFLKPGGRLIPAKIELHLGLVESIKSRDPIDGLASEGVPKELHWLRRYAVNAKHAATLSADDLLGGPVCLGTLDLLTEEREYFAWDTELIAERPGELHGLGGWFVCALTDGVSMTNSPLVADRIDRPQAFLPIDVPVKVKPGERVEVSIAVRPRDEFIAWSVRHPASGRHFRHSTWEGAVFDKRDLLRATPGHVPRPTSEANARSIILGYCDGVRTAQEIRDIVLLNHADLFPSPGAVSGFLADVLRQDTE